MTEIASNSPSLVSFVPEHSSSSNLIPCDERHEKTDRKRSGEPPSADISANKKISAKDNDSSVSASPSDPSVKPSLPNRPNVDNYATTFGYCNKNKPPYVV